MLDGLLSRQTKGLILKGGLSGNVSFTSAVPASLFTSKFQEGAKGSCTPPIHFLPGRNLVFVLLISIKLVSLLEHCI